MRAVYPWSGVVGQDALKRALALTAIDPGIGGVLVQGPRGVAKTTLARALSELVPGEFVELPLGASEERVTGTLDLGAALREGEVNFAPGLLARAHEGVLYVDEVNLLPDALIDLLLDAAASGRNVVERDGVSHEHAARFVLVGTMNPEEGELRPQLTDRFGLSVDAEGVIAPKERSEIVLRRIAFDADPEAFRKRFANEQVTLAVRCAQARTLLPKIALDGSALAQVTERCHAAGVEGVRADLAMLRAARAHAAWHGRAAISSDDIEAVAELALAHRRRPGSPPRGGQSSPPPRATPNSGPPPTNAMGAMQAVPVRAEGNPRLPVWLSAGERAELHRRGRAQTRGERGARARLAKTGSVDWFATLSRTRKPRMADLRRRARRSPSKQLWVLALDCSSSMLRAGALASAKGVAHALTHRAHRAGAHVALIGFRGEHAELTSSPSAHRSTREHALAGMVAGGSTPLRAALEQALALCETRAYRDACKRIILLTDGRTRERVELPMGDVELVVIDCERGPVRLGRAAQLASGLGASCLHIDTLR